VHPNTITYNTVITAYSRAGYPQRSEELLQEMITTTTTTNNNTQTTVPVDDTTTTPGQERKRFDNSSGTPTTTTTTTIQPDVQSFTSILAGWARVGTIEAAERADELLRIMQLPQINIDPNVDTYGSCIHCWARVAAGRRNNLHDSNSNSNHHHHHHHKDSSSSSSTKNQEKAVQRAEELFHEMRVHRNIQPDVFAYTGVLNAYGRSGRVEKAASFLEACLQEYDTTKNPRMKPTAVTFTAILNALSKVAMTIPDAATKAHLLLHRMKDEYGIEPNVFSYSAVLDAYARSKRPDAADKALRLFRDMRGGGGGDDGSAAAAGDVDVNVGLEPNAYTCTNVLKALARGGRVEEAEELLTELVHDQRITIKLGPRAFSSVLHGWSKSKRRDAAERAEDLLIRMQNLYRQQKIEGPPNTICYNSVLACWAHSNVPGAAERADLLLCTIDQQQQQQQQQQQDNVSSDRKGGTSSHYQQDRHHQMVRCNRIMYNTVMNAWANEGNIVRVNELYQGLVTKSRVDRTFIPDEWTYRAVWKAIWNSNQIRTEEKYQRLQRVLAAMHNSGISPTTNMKLGLRQLRQHQERNTTTDTTTTNIHQ